jgi:hypothetical protein
MKDRERCVPEMDGAMGATTLWKKIKPAVRAEMEQQEVWFAAWADRLKAGIAEVAATKSSQRFGREEEKE